MKQIFKSRFVRNVAAIIGFVATVITIITYLLPQKIKIEFDIIANSNVIDINAEITKLDIFYDSINVTKTNQSLKLYIVRIINAGDVDILKANIDDDVPLGLLINHGRIVDKPEIINASNSYLKNYVNDSLVNPNKLIFKKFYIEKGEFFDIKLLILHSRNEIPEISSTGKIGGLKEGIQVLDNIVNQKSLSKEEIFNGTWSVQLIRLICYPLFLLLLIAWVAPLFVEGIFPLMEMWRRKRVVIKFLEINNSLIPNNKMIYDTFKHGDTQLLIIYSNLLNDEEALKMLYIDFLNNPDNKGKLLRKVHPYRSKPVEETERTMVERMVKENIIIANDNVTINDSYKNELNKFIDYLKSINDKSMNSIKSYNEIIQNVNSQN